MGRYSSIAIAAPILLIGGGGAAPAPSRELAAKRQITEKGKGAKGAKEARAGVKGGQYVGVPLKHAPADFAAFYDDVVT